MTYTEVCEVEKYLRQQCVEKYGEEVAAAIFDYDEESYLCDANAATEI